MVLWMAITLFISILLLFAMPNMSAEAKIAYADELKVEGEFKNGGIEKNDIATIPP